MTYSTPSYGNCFMFNFNYFNRNGSDSESSVLPGPGYGLSLVLDLEQEHYGSETEAEGIRWDNRSKKTYNLVPFLMQYYLLNNFCGK